MTRIDETYPFVAVRIAILTMSDTRSTTEDKSGNTLAAMIEEAGHKVAARALVKDDLPAIRGTVEKWIADPGVDVVITPHPGEMARLTGLPAKEVLQRRVEVAREFAEKRGVYLVLKGFRTLIASPDGQVLVNPSGTPAMAKGGSGDILTGMIAGFLAQFPKAAPALVIAAAFRMLDALRLFDLAYVITGGGPGTATEPVSLYAFIALMQRLRFGYGSALSMIVFLLTFGFTLVWVRMLGRSLTGGRS